MAAMPIVALAPIFNTCSPRPSSTPRRLVVAISSSSRSSSTRCAGCARSTRSTRELMRSYAATPWTIAAAGARCPARCRSSSPACGWRRRGAVIAAVVAEYFGGLQNGLGPAITSAAAAPPTRGPGRIVSAAIVLGLLFYLAAAARRAAGDALAHDHTRRTLVSRFLRSQPPAAAALASLRAGDGRVRRRRQQPSGSDVDPRPAAPGADQGQAAAAVVHPGPVRRLLRRRRPGLLQGRRASTSQILEGGVDIVPQTVLAQGQADYAIAWVPKALAVARAGRRHHRRRPGLPALRHLQVSFKDKDITDAGRPQGQEGRQLGLRQRVRAVRRHDQGRARTRPRTSRWSSSSSTCRRC